VLPASFFMVAQPALSPCVSMSKRGPAVASASAASTRQEV